LRRECARDFQQTLLAVGQGVGLRVGLRAEPHEGQQFLRLLGDALLCSRIQRGRRSAAPIAPLVTR